MLFIEEGSRALANFLTDYKASEQDEETEAVLADFEDTKFKVTADEQQGLTISLKSPTVKHIAKAFNVQAELADFLPTAGLSLLAQGAADSDLSFHTAKAKLNDESIKAMSLLLFKVLAIPLKAAFASADRNTDGQQMTIPLKGDEAMYVLPLADRVFITYALQFTDPSDAVLAKVFLQEFLDTRQKHTVQNAPIVIYGKEQPMEMAQYIPALSPAQAGKTHYISFVLLPRHFTPEKREKAVSMMLSFPVYLDYHLKVTKAYLHNRMRSKVAEFLKVLNRAKPDYLSSVAAQTQSQ